MDWVGPGLSWTCRWGMLGMGPLRALTPAPLAQRGAARMGQKWRTHGGVGTLDLEEGGPAGDWN